MRKNIDYIYNLSNNILNKNFKVNIDIINGENEFFTCNAKNLPSDCVKRAILKGKR